MKKDSPQSPSKDKEDTSPVMESASQTAAKKKKKSRALILLVAAGFIVIGSIVALLMYDVDFSNNDNNEEELSVVELERQATEYQASDDMSKAIEAYAVLIERTDEATERAGYYMAKSAIASNFDDLELAKRYVQQSLEERETAVAYTALARLSLQMDDDTAGAIEYYEQALALMQQSDGVERDEIVFIESKIIELKSGNGSGN